MTLQLHAELAVLVVAFSACGLSDEEWALLQVHMASERNFQELDWEIVVAVVAQQDMHCPR